MTNDEAITNLNMIRVAFVEPVTKEQRKLIDDTFEMAIKALEQQPCEMTTEEYRQRMIQAFHNADTDELIAVCVLPTEKEFEHMEWLLKNHYKKDPCEESEDKTE